MLPFLYETNHIFRYYFKFLIYYGIVSFNSIVLIPAFLTRPCDVRNLLWVFFWELFMFFYNIFYFFLVLLR